MARARNIKPGFFLNEDLVNLPFSTRLLFVGLWTIADREGRLCDKPKQIKMAVFPGDDVDVDGGLQDLADAKFIVRYEVKAARYIEIINFIKHQHPHVKESASTIPAPCKPRTSTRLKRPLTDSPIPITESKTESNEEEEAPPPKPKVRKKVLTEIDPNFKAPKKEIEQATTERPTVDLDHETKNFI